MSTFKPNDNNNKSNNQGTVSGLFSKIKELKSGGGGPTFGGGLGACAGRCGRSGCGPLIASSSASYSSSDPTS